MVTRESLTVWRSFVREWPFLRRDARRREHRLSGFAIGGGRRGAREAWTRQVAKEASPAAVTRARPVVRALPAHARAPPPVSRCTRRRGESEDQCQRQRDHLERRDPEIPDRSREGRHRPEQ